MNCTYNAVSEKCTIIFILCFSTWVNVPANVSTEQMKVLSANEKLMDDLGANVTPAIYYMSKENTLQQAVGLPDQKTLNIIMGNK